VLACCCAAAAVLQALSFKSDTTAQLFLDDAQQALEDMGVTAA